MKKGIYFLLTLLLACGIDIHAASIHHDLNVSINIESQSLEVTDNISIPAAYLEDKDTVFFYLNTNFLVSSPDKKYVIKEIKVEEAYVNWAKKYMIDIAPNGDKDLLVAVKYAGEVNEEIQENAVAYARGFSTTSGIISSDGIFLAGSTIWTPAFEEDLFTFDMTVTIDKAWGIVSQGTRTKNEVAGEKRVVQYASPNLVDEVYLLGAKWTEYSVTADKVLVQAFLRTADEALATRYLDATSQYLKLYETLIGPYPYTKFALVENFWETGYGMPSFTLLGEKVIRFPFILHSSYPHELLHNWWGNSVYVNYDQGNWCEGLTAYMADHLIKEQRGQGSEYRRGTLEKFTNYVNEENDFPISEFRSRNNPAEEAIGYGKVLMFNDMLRYKYGDATFINAYVKFYEDNKFKYASFDDIRKSFEAITGSKKLQAFFDQWILRTGAPILKLSDVEVKQKKQYELSFTLSQIQKEDPFDLTIPVAIYLEGELDVTLKDIEMSKEEESYTFKFDKRPLKIDIDPQVNIFRRLDKNEIPPTLSKIFGAKESVIVLPKNSPHLQEYTELAETWKQIQEAQHKNLNIVFDTDLAALPTSPTWVLGFENKFADNSIIKNSYGSYLSDETITSIDKVSKEGSLVYSTLKSDGYNDAQIVGFIGANDPKAIAKLIRKLSHYGKYSYLGFEGEAATNVLKGEFPALNSPLTFYIEYDGVTPAITAKLKPREALAY